MVMPLHEGYDADTMQKLCNGGEGLILLIPRTHTEYEWMGGVVYLGGATPLLH